VVFTRAGMTTATDDLAKCSNIQIVSDLELICTTPLLDGLTVPTPNGAFIVVVTSDDAAIAPTATFESVLSSSAAYTAASF
jgi:hypothetical protein